MAVIPNRRHNSQQPLPAVPCRVQYLVFMMIFLNVTRIFLAESFHPALPFSASIASGQTRYPPPFLPQLCALVKITWSRRIFRISPSLLPPSPGLLRLEIGITVELVAQAPRVLGLVISRPQAKRPVHARHDIPHTLARAHDQSRLVSTLARGWAGEPSYCEGGWLVERSVDRLFEVL